MAERKRKKEAENLQSQITTTEASAVSGAVIAGVVAVFAPGGFSHFLTALSTIQLSTTVFSTIMSISSAINSWLKYSFAQDNAKNDMGALTSYLSASQIMDQSVNSTTQRLEDLEQKCLQ